MEKTLVKTVLDAVPGCLAVYRFGSWGTQDQRPDSDIDLAVKTDIGMLKALK